MTINADVLEAAQQATLETHRLDAKAARTGSDVDKAAAENHFRFVEKPALEAAFGQGHNVSTRGIRTVQPWHKNAEARCHAGRSKAERTCVDCGRVNPVSQAYQSTVDNQWRCRAVIHCQQA